MDRAGSDVHRPGTRVVSYIKARHWIDKATYGQLLWRWRRAPASDWMLKGDTGEYFLHRMLELKREVGKEAHDRLSASIPWAKDIRLAERIGRRRRR